MATSNRLQDDLYAKEEAKIARKRAANEERRQRILNAKTRVLGVDVDALDAQVEEKRKTKDNGKEYDLMLNAQAIEIEKMLAYAAEEEKQIKDYQSREIRKQWEESIKYKKDQEELAKKVKDIDFDKCGPSSLQSFAGEDPHMAERSRLQKEQMKRWVQEQVAEKNYLKKFEKNEDMSYAEMMKAIDAIRETTDKEEAEMKKYISRSVKLQNDELKVLQKYKNRNPKDDPEVDPKGSFFSFDEDKTYAIDANGRIIRKDMFKGFTEEQRRKFYQENVDIIRAKKELKENTQNEDYMWLLQQQMSQRAMEEIEYDNKLIADARKQQQLAFLREQIEEQNKNKETWKKMKNGSIEPGFFNNFGSSCR